MRFFSETSERTRVELEPRNLGRHGAGWEPVRSRVDDEGGWSLYLQRYGALFTTTRLTRAAGSDHHRALRQSLEQALGRCVVERR